MSVFNHTEPSTVAAGQPILSADVKAMVGDLDAAIGDKTALTTAVKTSIVAAINSEVAARAAADTTEAATRTSSDASLLTGQTVLTTRLNTAHDMTGNLSPGVVSAANLDAVVTAPQSIVWDQFNRIVPVGSNFLGKTRWETGTNLTISADGSNPYGNPTLFFGTAAAVGGKVIYVDEAGINVGDKVRFAMRINAASGTYTLRYQAYDSSDAQVGSLITSSTATPAGSEVLVKGGTLTVPATTSYIKVYIARASGTAVVSIYALWGSKGEYLSDYPPAGNGTPDPFATNDNLVWDPFCREFYPGQDFGGNSRWHQPTGYTLVYPDSTNPYGGATLTSTSTASQPGKNIYLAETGLSIGQQVAFTFHVSSTGGATMTCRCGFWRADGTLIGSVLSTAFVLSSTPKYISTPLTAIPTNTAYIKITTERSGAAATSAIYAMWGGVGGATPTPQPSPLTGSLIAGEALLNLYELGRARLKQWSMKVAALQTAVAGTKAVINLFGDSWFERDIIANPLRTSLYGLYGDAGSGYIGIALGDQYEYNWTTSRTGVWTETDIDSSPTAKGPDGTHAVTTSTSATWVVTATVTSFVLHYRTVVGGGSFGWKIDSGSVTTVSTDAAAGYVALPIAAGALGSHTLTISIPTAGSQGVLICGVEALKNQNGVRINKLGNGSSDTATQTATNAADDIAAYTALGGDVNIILLGTNDRVHGIAPSVYAGNLLTKIDRLQTALPLSDTILVAPGDVSDSSIFTSGAYNAACRHAATMRDKVAFVSVYARMNPYADSNTRGLMSDALHPNALGGKVISNILADFLRI